MVINNNLKLGFAVGAAQMLGAAACRELYEIYKAVDPLYGVRVKLREAKNQKRFEHIMSQTNLKMDLG